MTHERLGSMNDFAKEHGLDPGSEQLTTEYTAALADNYHRVRAVLAAQGLTEITVMPVPVVENETLSK